MPDTTKETIQDIQNENLPDSQNGNPQNIDAESVSDVSCLPAKVYKFYQPEQDMPDTTKKEDSIPVSTAVETKDVETKIAEATTMETEAVETATVNTRIVDTKAMDTKVVETTEQETTEGKPERTPFLQTKAAQKTRKFFAALFRKLGWLLAVAFRKLGRLLASAFRGLGVIYCRNICTYSNMILIGAAFLLCITGAFSQATFGILVLLNLLISIFADRKERKRLERVLMPKDAVMVEMDETAVSEEDKIATDGTVVSAAEAAQESDEIILRQRKSKLERSLDAYGRRMGAAALVLSLILFVQSFVLRHESFQDGVLSMCSAFVAVMPVGMYLLHHLAEFVGSAKCSKQGLKVQDRRAFMRLAEMDVLCVCDSSLLGESDSAKEMIGSLQENGTRIVLISEEDTKVLSDRAKAMGVKGSESAIDASTLHDMGELRKAILRQSVIGNATSLQKGIFVDLLRESKAMVAVMAKGEADCAAVQNADVSVGFTPKGEKLAGLSDMYMENGCLVSLSKAYAESRKMSGNLKNLSSLFFMKNITALLLAVYAVVCYVSYPITLSMWTLLGMFTIGIPCVFLFFYGEERGYKEKFLLASLKMSLPMALAGTLTVIVLLRYGIVFGLDENGTVTAAVMLLAFAGFLMLWKVCLPISVFDVILLVACVAGFLFCFAFGKPLFGMGKMDLQIRMILVLVLIAEESAYRLFGALAKLPVKTNSGKA